MTKFANNDKFTVLNINPEDAMRDGDNNPVMHDYLMVEQMRGELYEGIDSLVDKVVEVINSRPDVINGVGPRGGTNHKVTASRTVYHWIDRGVIVKLAA